MARSIAGPLLLCLVAAGLTAAIAGLWYLVERTKTGKAMRAVAEDKEIASLMGIDVDRTIVTTFAVGGAMAGVAGILWGILFRSVVHTTGFLPGIIQGDVNNDGVLTPADFNAWVIAFNNQAPECDQNGDGLCTPADFNAWILNFNAGCD